MERTRTLTEEGDECWRLALSSSSALVLVRLQQAGSVSIHWQARYHTYDLSFMSALVLACIQAFFLMTASRVFYFLYLPFRFSLSWLESHAPFGVIESLAMEGFVCLALSLSIYLSLCASITLWSCLIFLSMAVCADQGLVHVHT